MTEKQKQQYADDIVSGSLPDQESFTREEAKYLVQTTLSWCGQQIEHATGEMLHDDVEEMVAACEFKDVVEAIKDVQEGFESDLISLQEFIETWI